MNDKKPEQPDFFVPADFTDLSGSDDPALFFFDDEPLERILYGEGDRGPTVANLFPPARRSGKNE